MEKKIDSGIEAAKKLNLKIYQSVKTVNKDEACPICFDTFENDCGVLQLPCKHVFHYDCVMKWFEKNSTCPKCRSDI